MQKIRFTKQGYEELKKKYEQFIADRPDAVFHLKTAREMGDLSENGYYKASRAKLSFIDGQIARIKFQLKYAEIVEPSKKGTIDVGTTIVLKKDSKELIYKIVGDLEANPREGTISLLSPIGKAVRGKNIGDDVTIETPTSKVIYQLVKIN